MSEEKQDKQFKIKLKEYDREKEKRKSEAFEKFARGEELSEEESRLINEEIPTEEELKGIEKSSELIQQTLRDIVEPTIQASKTISQNIDKIMQPMKDTISHISEGLQQSLKPVFDELDNQYKSNPLTRKELEEGTQFLVEYTKEKEELIQDIEALNKRQLELYSKIFDKTGATEQEIFQYNTEGEEIDFPVDILEDISRKLQGKQTSREEIEKQVKKYLQTKLSKNIREKLKESEEKNIPLNEYLTEKELKKVQKACEDLKEESIFFERRPSRIELEREDFKREMNQEPPLKLLFYKSTEIHFENITQEDFISYLKEEIEILKKAIEIRKVINQKNNEIIRIFSRASNPYFEGKKENELSEEEKQLKEEFYNTSFILFQNSTNLEKLFSRVFLSRTNFEELDLERQERFFEFLQYNLEDLQELLKEWTPQEEEKEIVEQYLSTNSKNKLLTTEKIVPQVFLQGDKIEKLFKDKESGKIEKVTFDLSSGDSNKNFIIHFLMKEYPLTFTEDTFKTLESLMTIQNQMEKQFGTLKGINFDTKYVIYLNRGGRVTNYSKDLIQKTNRELISLMSAIGSLDTTDFFFKYYNLDEETIVEENEAIFQSIKNEKEWNKKVEEIRKEKIKQLPENKKFPFDKIKKISTLQPFVSLKGLNIESEEEAFNNTFWKFNDIDEKPIPLFEILKMTGRFASLPLEMDSYLTDSTINNEVTRNLKTIIANLNYYKTNTQMKKDKTTKNFFEYYFEGTLEGETKQRIFEPFEAMQIFKTKEKKLVGFWKYKTTRTIDSIAKDCKFDEERGIGIPKEWKHNKERPLFVDSIIHYLRKAKEDKNIDDFILYTTKDKIVKDEDYITINEKRSQKTKDKIRGKETKKKQTKNPSIEKISIIIK